jgi:hypothetical protein
MWGEHDCCSMLVAPLHELIPKCSSIPSLVAFDTHKFSSPGSQQHVLGVPRGTKLPREPPKSTVKHASAAKACKDRRGDLCEGLTMSLAN